MQPRGSKAKRAAARRRAPPNHRSEFLKARSVTYVAARRYRSCSDAFLRQAHKEPERAHEGNLPQGVLTHVLYCYGGRPQDTRA